MGERDSLWDVIVNMNDDDISFTHILPKLNLTDVKFLYGVNSETRKLMKRCIRTDDLTKKFKVRQMSSVLTLEVAWEHKSLWRRSWDETDFCEQVAETNKLELLKWIREEKKCDWDEKTIRAAAEQGNLEMIKYCVANKCPIGVFACANAAKNGHLEVLKYLREEVKAPWGWTTAANAAENGHLHILEYLVERKYDKYNEWACKLAAENGHLDCLKYLRETAFARWTLLGRTSGARTKPNRVCTIPPRQKLPITRRLAIRRRSIAHVITRTHTHTACNLKRRFSARIPFPSSSFFLLVRFLRGETTPSLYFINFLSLSLCL
jgi:hypothetical protein